ncbi:hypothetical protein [Paracoccus spongiarum]|uniref:Uncharacterized protein n=1 Tax=Paracoccus spongiarum TaxID=3064387 RepID=A0ABT9JIC9_9RHOB|nr:hypothetical protein [Paracoccus sp. 2205BS29-5]MDP5308807.1 hypothetical protein [Paracoccus sp. 2205BS29-5]
MTTPKTRLIGATAIAALALAGALVAWQASSDSPADLAQLSDDDKLEILNSGDADAVSDLLEAEEAAAQAHFARERLERQKREAEIEVERTEAKARGAAYWDSFNPDSIDLSGFDFAMAEVVSRAERRAMLDKASFVTDFKRAGEMRFPPSRFDCNPSRYTDIRNLMKGIPEMSMPVGLNDVARVLDYLADRAALETGDCSCATQAVPVEIGWEFLKQLTDHPSGQRIRGSMAQSKATKGVGSMFRHTLGAEARQFCRPS